MMLAGKVDGEKVADAARHQSQQRQPFKVLPLWSAILIWFLVAAIVSLAGFIGFYLKHDIDSNNRAEEAVSVQLDVVNRVRSQFETVDVVARSIEGLAKGTLRAASSAEDRKLLNITTFPDYVRDLNDRGLTAGIAAITTVKAGVVNQVWISGGVVPQELANSTSTAFFSVEIGRDLSATHDASVFSRIETGRNDLTVVLEDSSTVLGAVVPIFSDESSRDPSQRWGHVVVYISVEAIIATADISSGTRRLSWRLVTQRGTVVRESDGFAQSKGRLRSAGVSPEVFDDGWLLQLRPDVVDFTETEVTTILLVSVILACVVTGIIYACYIVQTIQHDPLEHAPKHGPLVLVQLNVFRYAKMWAIMPEEAAEMAQTIDTLADEAAKRHRCYRAEVDGDAVTLACRDVNRAFRVAEDIQLNFYAAVGQFLDSRFADRVLLQVSISRIGRVRVQRTRDGSIHYRGEEVDGAVLLHANASEIEPVVMNMSTREAITGAVVKRIVMRPAAQEAVGAIAFDFHSANEVSIPNSHTAKMTGSGERSTTTKGTGATSLLNRTGIAMADSTTGSSSNTGNDTSQNQSSLLRSGSGAAGRGSSATSASVRIVNIPLNGTAPTSTAASAAPSIEASATSPAAGIASLLDVNRMVAAGSSYSIRSGISSMPGDNFSTAEGDLAVDQGGPRAIQMLKENRTVKRLAERATASKAERDVLFSLGTVFFEAYRIMFKAFQPAERNNILKRLKMLFGLSNTNMMESLAVRAALILVKSEMALVTDASMSGNGPLPGHDFSSVSRRHSATFSAMQDSQASNGPQINTIPGGVPALEVRKASQ